MVNNDVQHQSNFPNIKALSENVEGIWKKINCVFDAYTSVTFYLNGT